jgi:hypothetical protein
VFAVRLYLPAHAAEVLAREVDTPDPGPVYLVIMLRLPWGQVGVGVIVTGVNRDVWSLPLCYVPAWALAQCSWGERSPALRSCEGLGVVDVSRASGQPFPQSSACCSRLSVGR